MQTTTRTSQPTEIISLATTAPQVAQQSPNNIQLHQDKSLSRVLKMIAICYAGLFISFGSVILIAYSAGYPVTW